MNQPDPIFESFYAQQCREAKAMEALNPDLLRIKSVPPDGFLVQILCKGLLRAPGGTVEEAPAFVVGLRLPADYLRDAPNPVGIASIIAPNFPHHPNVHAASGQMCLGHLRAATPVTDIIIQVTEILTWVNFATHDVLSPEAAQWARNHLDRFPLERRAIHLPPISAAS